MGYILEDFQNASFVRCGEKLLSLQVMHVLGFDPHAFSHFRDERKRRRTRVSSVMIFGSTCDQEIFSWDVVTCAFYYTFSLF